MSHGIEKDDVVWDYFRYEDSSLSSYSGNLQLILRIVRAYDLVDKSFGFTKQDPMLKMTVGQTSEKEARHVGEIYELTYLCLHTCMLLKT